MSGNPENTPLPKEIKRSQRTPLSGKRAGSRLKLPFKSPVHPKQQPNHPKITPEQEVLNLQRKIDALDEEIAQLEKEYDIKELKEQIDKLHEYNDIKDTGQMLIGKLAEIEGKTTKTLYAEFGLDLED